MVNVDVYFHFIISLFLEAIKSLFVVEYMSFFKRRVNGCHAIKRSIKFNLSIIKSSVILCSLNLLGSQQGDMVLHRTYSLDQSQKSLQPISNFQRLDVFFILIG